MIRVSILALTHTHTLTRTHARTHAHTHSLTRCTADSAELLVRGAEQFLHPAGLPRRARRASRPARVCQPGHRRPCGGARRLSAASVTAVHQPRACIPAAGALVFFFFFLTKHLMFSGVPEVLLVVRIFEPRCERIPCSLCRWTLSTHSLAYSGLGSQRKTRSIC
jgi:hypothetical protein